MDARLGEAEGEVVFQAGIESSGDAQDFFTFHNVHTDAGGMAAGEGLIQGVLDKQAVDWASLEARAKQVAQAAHRNGDGVNMRRAENREFATEIFSDLERDSGAYHKSGNRQIFQLAAAQPALEADTNGDRLAETDTLVPSLLVHGGQVLRKMRPCYQTRVVQETGFLGKG